MTYIIIAYAIFVLWTVIELIAAPKGYEDSNGFHYGTPPDNRNDFRKTMNN